jgi:hypothetical protein
MRKLKHAIRALRGRGIIPVPAEHHEWQALMETYWWMLSDQWRQFVLIDIGLKWS